MCLPDTVRKRNMCVRVCVCVFFLGKGRGGNTPYARTQGE